MGSLVYASRAGVRVSGVVASPLDGVIAPVTWPHNRACAWTAAWLTTRGREMLGPREMLLRRDWRGVVRWREHGEARRRGHRPDLAGRLPDGRLMPIEVELTEKSSARLRAVLDLHAHWVTSGASPAVMYVCSSDHLADRVRSTGELAGLSVKRGTLRIEALETIERQAVDACAAASKQWHLTATGVV